MSCVMKCNYGFDIHPPIEPTAENQKKYKDFLIDVEMVLWGEYDSDGEGGVIKVLDNSDKSYLRISSANGPPIPRNPERCRYFLRFSSWVDYEWPFGMASRRVDDIRRMAQNHFGSRVHEWKESPKDRDYGLYSWEQVDDTANEYYLLENADRQEADAQQTDVQEADTQEDDAREADVHDTSSQMADTEETPPPNKVHVQETDLEMEDTQDTISQMADDEETPTPPENVIGPVRRQKSTSRKPVGVQRRTSQRRRDPVSGRFLPDV